MLSSVEISLLILSSGSETMDSSQHLFYLMLNSYFCMMLSLTQGKGQHTKILNFELGLTCQFNLYVKESVCAVCVQQAQHLLDTSQQGKN